jgi:ABC-type nitrate/sulfonate/bicarbonate transport system permease component
VTTGRGRGFRNLALALWLPLGVVALWQVLASHGFLNVLFFPPPSEVLSAGQGMLVSGELGRQVGATLSRMFTGATIGTFCGLSCGLAMGAFDPVRRSLEPAVSALNSTPKLALLPMLMLFTGIGEAARIVPVALTCFVVLAMHGLDAVRGVNLAYVEMARNYGAGPGAMLRRVYLPASLPQIFTGLRLALGRALVITISVEIVSSTDGLGSMIWMSWQTFSTDKLYIGVITAAAMGALFHNGLEWLEGHLIPWRSRLARA